MIVFDLSCSEGHRFEGWFGSSADFEQQKELGLLACPLCDCPEVGKAPMAPAVSAKSSSQAAPVQAAEQMARGDMPAPVKKAFEALVKAQAQALAKSTWVGDKFTEKAREMHYGETVEAPIHGRATRDQADELAAEGIAVAPLLVPVAPPEELN